ncbi:MAG: ECF transporter S component [Spirochaetes bacterium]|nr:ECF transporter S component [Spirochaetota bacterium]
MNKIAGRVHPALIAVWAAIVAVGHLMPTIPMLGTGRSFSLSAALTPLSGIFFGPIAGALCSAAGGFVGSFIAPHTAWMGPFTFIVGTSTAFTTGCVAWGKWPPVKLSAGGNFIINGGIIVYIAGVSLWYTQEIGRSIVYFPIVSYGFGFVALIIGSIFAHRLFASKKPPARFAALWLCAFAGMMGGASIGNFFSLVLFGLPRELWAFLMFVQPLERVVFALGAMLIGAPLIAGLEKIGIFVGPHSEDDATHLPAP